VSEVFTQMDREMALAILNTNTDKVGTGVLYSYANANTDINNNGLLKKGQQDNYIGKMSFVSGIAQDIVKDLHRNGVTATTQRTPELLISNLRKKKYTDQIGGIGCLEPATATLCLAIIAAIVAAIPKIISACNENKAKAIQGQQGTFKNDYAANAQWLADNAISPDGSDMKGSVVRTTSGGTTTGGGTTGGSTGGGSNTGLLLGLGLLGAGAYLYTQKDK
jgi:hypothetical protein